MIPKHLYFEFLRPLNRLKGHFYDNNTPLKDITYSEKKLKSVQPQKKLDKVPIEQIRFWRRHDLLPFYEEGKHAQINMPQIIWLYFLQTMKNFGCSLNYMQKAEKYFIKRAYNDDLVLQNLLTRKRELSKIVTDTNKLANDTVESKELLDFTNQLLSDIKLLHSLKMEINYFTCLIIYFLDKLEDVSIVMDQLGEFGIMIENAVYDLLPEGFELSKTISANEPLLIISIKSLIENFFDDSNLDENALNIRVLNDKEKQLITDIRNKRVNSVTINVRNGDILRYDLKYLVKKSIEDPQIKAIKKTLGLHNYGEIKYSMVNKKEIIIENTHKKIF